MAQAPETDNEMPKAYDPGSVEGKWYDLWMEKGYFTPEIDHDKEPFVIIMPPPNLTGELHMGHALTATLEDIMTRWHRMKGDPTLWLPGVDHASIAAQVVVERLIAKEGLDRHTLGREKFIERMWTWVNATRDRITEQHKRLGVSCDWTREKFTLDEGPSRAVRTAFKRLYDKGLIYKGERITNWCPRCATALSDLEVEHQDEQGNLWYVRYPLVDNPDEYITVATTRPETILGDTAVAVNPDDERYKDMVGKKVLLPAVNREIEIIADEAVDPSFGTGAVKITPSHDPVDFEVGQRQNLEFINILNKDATMNEHAGPYEGMDRYECRDAICRDLDESGQLVKIEPHSHAVGHCERCKTTVEPVASHQWYVKIEPLAEKAIEAVTNGSIEIIPARLSKVYMNWMENIRDWCISRQLWWGLRIPVWYCGDCGKEIVSIEEISACPECSSTNIEQDPDVLDTWFSSGLWPHSTLGWPDDTEDLRYFYPTTVMETGSDLIFFWVARMIMMGIEDTGEIPFRTIYFHGLIRDAKGEKMSKTKGNGLDPLESIDKYGTDALRFGLLTGTSAGNDSRLSVEKMESGRNYANKLWNATRFVIRNMEQERTEYSIGENLPTEDRWILSRLNRVVENVNKLLGDFQFEEAQRQMYDFLWNEYCDWYIEISKIRLHSEETSTVSPVPVLVHVLETSLRLLHPYMPFLSEELWQNLVRFFPEDALLSESIMVAPYPETDTNRIDEGAEKVMESVIEIIRSIRNTRAQYNVEAGRWIEANVYAGDLSGEITSYLSAIESLARSRPVHILDSRLTETESDDNVVVSVLRDTEVVIPMESMVDMEAEKKRLEKEMEQNQAEFTRLEARLKDEKFLSRAPAAVVEKERQKYETIKDKLERMNQQLQKYKGGNL